MKKIILETIFFSTFLTITVGRFVNQLIKKFWPYLMAMMQLFLKQKKRIFKVI